MVKIVGLATIPQRLKTLQVVLDSLRFQVDEIHLSLNGFDQIPKLKGKNINAFLNTNEKGDANKFFKVDECDGYYFSCDDDIVYPYDYVETMIPYIDRGHLATFHGAVFKTHMTSYFKDRKLNVRCTQKLDRDTFVHVPGSGVSGFNTQHLKVRYSDFKKPNMADVFLGMLCQKQGVRRIAIAHNSGYIIPIPNQSTIYRSTRRKHNHQTQTNLVKTIKWTL